MKVSSAYDDMKDSGVDWIGNIPDTWTVAPLKSLGIGRDALFIDGDWIESKDLSEEGIRYITTGNVGEGRYKEQGSGFISKETFDRLRCTEVQPGDVLVSRLNLPIARACIVPELGARIVTSVDNVIVRPRPGFDARYIVFMLSGASHFFNTENLARGTTMCRISRSSLGNIRYAFPSLDEQSAIATALDRETARIDALIEKKTRFIELLKEKRQALITQAVTKGLDPTVSMKDSGVAWIGEVPAHWFGSYKLVSLAKQVKGSFVNGPFGSDLLSSELQTEGVPVIYIRDVKPTGYSRKSKDCVTEKKAKQLSVCQVRPGDVLLAKVGSPPGDACVYPIDEPLGIVTQDVVRIRPERMKVVPEYFCFLMNSGFGRSLIDSISVESTRKRFGLGELKQLRVALPAVPEQEQIARWIEDRTSKIDSLILKSEQSAILLKERRSALITAAVTGQIDLREGAV